LSGLVTARWFDPTSATYTTVSGSPFTNTGTKQFTPPSGNHSDGANDWVLVLETQTVNNTPTPVQPTLTPSLTVTPTPPVLTITPTQTPTSIPTSTIIPTPTNIPTPTSVPLGIVAAYNFNEGTGKSVSDKSSFHNNGALSTPLWTTQGKYGKALNFQTLTNKVTIADSNSLDLTSQLTLEAWVYPTSGLSGNVWRTVILKEQGAGLAYSLYANGQNNRPYNVITLNLGSEIYTAGTSTLAINTWTHLAATFNGTSLKLYKNGTLVSSTTKSGQILTSNKPLSIGGNSFWTNEVFIGRIDEVRIYNKALSSLEIQKDMNTPL